MLVRAKEGREHFPCIVPVQPGKLEQERVTYFSLSGNQKGARVYLNSLFNILPFSAKDILLTFKNNGLRMIIPLVLWAPVWPGFAQYSEALDSP